MAQIIHKNLQRTIFYSNFNRMFSKKYFLVEYDYVEDAFYKRSKNTLVVYYQFSPSSRKTFEVSLRLTEGKCAN